MVLLPSTYGDGQSLTFPQQDMATPVAEDDFFIPVTLDSTDSVPPLSRNRKINEQPTTRDYFAGSKQTSIAGIRDDFQDLVAGSSRSQSTERSQSRQRRSPLIAQHIASQQRGRKSSIDVTDTLRKQYDPDNDGLSATTSPTAPGFDRSHLSPAYGPLDTHERDGFRLQEAPKTRPGASREDSKQSLLSSSSIRDTSGHTTPKDIAESGRLHSPTFFDTFESLDPSKRSGSIRRARSPGRSPATLGGASQYDRPARDDSLFKQPSVKQTVTRKEVPRPEGESPVDAPASYSDERKASGSSLLGRQESKLLSGRATPRQLAPIIATSLVDGPPARSPRRPTSAKLEDESDIATPRNGRIAPPSSEQRHRLTNSISSIQSENFSTQESLAHPSEDDAGRMLPAEHQGLFRRVSKAVKHGRSLSEKNNIASPTWKRNGSTDIGSPPVGSLDPREEMIQLRNKLQLAQRRVVELEVERVDLQEKVNGNVDLRSMNVELREKRSTMAFLDTQREMVIRELEVMTEHLSKVKDSRVPLDMPDLQSAVMRDFAASLQKLKDSLGTQIEDMMRKKHDLASQVTGLSQEKDKTYQDYENLSGRNAQLKENNQQLLQSIQDMYKQTRAPSSASYATSGAPQHNGLGIFPNQTQTSLTPVDSSVSQFSVDTETDSMTGLTGPKVVNIQKAQPKKFNWKRGGQTVGKNITKGLKGAFGGTQASTLRDEQFAEGLPYGSIPSGELPSIGTSPFAPSKGNDPGRQWNFLNASAQKAAQATKAPGGPNTSVAAISLPADSGVFRSLPFFKTKLTKIAVFGSDLAARCDYEKRIIPAIVSHCIEEVELRGIALEGIYRKSGSSSQVKTIQVGFEKDLNYDISDPDLDIHAVTSALKQYFRKLPNPLITFEVYDALLEAAGGDGPPTMAPGLGMGGMGMGLTPDKGTKAEEEEKARKVKEVVDSLPTSHRETLEFLIEHLVRVMEKESENLVRVSVIYFIVSADSETDDATQHCRCVCTDHHASPEYRARND